MTDTPETRYTRSTDGTNLAYQVSGDGPLELVFLSGPFPIDLLFAGPPLTSEFSRAPHNAHRSAIFRAIFSAQVY